MFFSQGYAGTPGPPGAPGERGTRVFTTAFISVLLYFFFFISNIILKNALSPFSLPSSFSRRMSLYSPLIVGWSIAKNPREQLRGKLILLREVLASLSRKIPERNQVTFAQQKSLLKECLLHSTIYLISFFKGAPGIFGTPGGDGDSGLAVSIYFFLPISSGRGGGGNERKVKSFVGLKPDLRLKELFSTVVF